MKTLCLSKCRNKNFSVYGLQRTFHGTPHVNKLKGELSRVTGSIYKIRNLLPTWLKQTLYYSLFYSKISYGILVWGTTINSNYVKLITLQKRILRMCENYKGDIRNIRTQPLFIKYNMLQADQIYYFKLLQWIHKHRIYSTPKSSLGPYQLRDPKRRMPSIRTNYGRTALSYQITKMLNRTDMTIDYNKTFYAFKKQCRSFLVGSGISFSVL